MDIELHDWRRDWEFLRNQLAKRGISIKIYGEKTARVHVYGPGQMEFLEREVGRYAEVKIVTMLNKNVTPWENKL